MNDIPAADRLVTPTDNLPPLQDLLPVETTALRARAEALADGSTRAVVNNQETAEKATLLAGMLRDHLRKIDEAREERKRPYLEGGRAIDAHYNGIAGLLAVTDKGKVVGGPLHNVMQLIDQYRREQEAATSAERLRLEQEAEAARQAAADAAAQAAVSGTVEDEIAAKQAHEETQRLERQATQAATPIPIKTAYGVSANRRAVYRAEITDLRKAITHCLKINPAAIRQAVQSIYDAQVRANVRMLPGASVVEDSQTVVRTR